MSSRPLTLHAQPVPRQIGKYIVRGGAVTNLEGDPQYGRVVIIEWESMEAAKRFYYSAEYQALVKLRLTCSVGTGAIIEGSPPAG